ncbi:MAG TPA: hypothetical protein VFI19_05930 [Nocardioides sp.]|nr:hypothetical protein [Nocardioides sp.]
MTPENTTQLVLVLLAAANAFAAMGWSRNGSTVGVPLSMLALAAAAVVAAVADDLSSGRVATTVLVVLAGLLAVVGGGPVTTRIFAIIDGQDDVPQTLDQAGQVLRGGAWIGALERLAVFAGLASGFPEGVAVVLALKGVGRFPDLRAEGRGGAATERFIIGTFASVLWAAACAGVVALVLR